MNVLEYAIATEGAPDAGSAAAWAVPSAAVLALLASEAAIESSRDVVVAYYS